MKRPLLVLAILLLLFVSPITATSLTFQNFADKNSIIGLSTPGFCDASAGGVGYTTSTTAGNHYMWASNFCGLQNKAASPFTYAAWTNYGQAPYQAAFSLGDTSNATLWTATGVGAVAGTRFEINVVGGTAYLYRDGILITNSTPLSQNPSYIRWVDAYGDSVAVRVDDFVLGSSDSKHIVGMPGPNGYFIKKDMVTPAASGVYNYSTGVLVDSNNMYTTWGRSNLTAGDNANESMYLQNAATGTVYETHYTANATAGTTTWDVATSLIAASAPYGRYQVRFADFYSDDISYIANGASITFDADDYSQQDTATITYVIDGAYWDTSTYTYSMKIYSANDWSVTDTQSIVTSTGTKTYQFTSDDTQGEYYAVIIAAPNIGGDDIWMNYDYASLNAYLTFTGYVNNETGYVQSGANVSIVQGGIVSNSVTVADGSYTATGFLTGAVLTFNITKTGYHEYLASLTPMTAKSISLNFTLNSTTPTYTGLGIGGIAREGLFDGTTITKGYGRPMSGTTVYLKNTTNGEFYTKTTNMAGWYLCDEGTSCFLTSKRPYDAWGEKLGYNNSANYTVVTA